MTRGEFMKKSDIKFIVNLLLSLAIAIGIGFLPSQVYDIGEYISIVYFLVLCVLIPVSFFLFIRERHRNNTGNFKRFIFLWAITAFISTFSLCNGIAAMYVGIEDLYFWEGIGDFALLALLLLIPDAIITVLVSLIAHIKYKKQNNEVI
jgi:hypothetical protein